MAQDDVINLDPFIIQRLQQSSQTAAATQNVPTATPAAPMSTNPQITNLPGLIQQDTFEEGQPVTVGDSIRNLLTAYEPVSYTHLTLPTIYSV